MKPSIVHEVRELKVPARPHWGGRLSGLIARSSPAGRPSNIAKTKAHVQDATDVIGTHGAFPSEMELRKAVSSLQR